MSGWLGIFFLSLSWVYFLPVYTPSRPLRGLVLIALGVFFMLLSVSSGEKRKPALRDLFLLIPFTVAAAVIPFPYSIGFVLLSAGWFILIAGGNLRAAGRAGNALVFSGLVVTLQTAVIPLLYKFGARVHEVPFLTHVVGFLLNLFGLSASALNDTVFAQTFERPWPLPATWDSLGLHEILLLFIGVCVFTAFMPEKLKRRKAAFFFTALAVYFTLRLVFIHLLFLNFPRIDLYWDKDLKFMTLLLAVFIPGKIMPVKLKEVDLNFFPRGKFNKKTIVLCLLVFIAVFCLTGMFAFSDPGIRKEGRIIIDEAHSDWEWTTKPFDKRKTFAPW